MGHTHNADPARGKVCSHLVTGEMLAGWGFPVEKTEKIVGSKTVVRPGLPVNGAKHAAWGAGHVRICTVTRSAS